ncbi:Nif3-like dinuclear metal center hexameric protein [Micromonospora fiedleri]|uniref:GTP cyclohydrolase 1 type 2 homolog n=1 Tax=Micromonospora fiedleri TaxID=1157498 RepID=A0ABS1UHS6_9ACTN|nr:MULTISPECIES: Nif3-like dinuclear metal center hexameric protein [Micromonospora]MBL6275868.1 Nif3-like dinuclear metal center hexameric protein [Micromonospora fiedleri]WSK41976.1 Nif3-like dinuclear metal center hexameric protein [Micromonospora maris]
MSTTTAVPTVADVVAELERRYPPSWAEEWDRVGLVLGEPDAQVRRVLCVVDVVPETVAEALAAGVDMIVAHHPLLLRGVSSVAPTTYKGRIIHQLIKADIALYVAHTNADVAAPGVSDALAGRLGLTDLRPLQPARPGTPAAGEGRGVGRIGRLPRPMSLAELTRHATTVLPVTAVGVRAAGAPDRIVRTLAVCGGSGDSFLADASAAGVDAYLTADLRHHPAGEHLATGGPALLDATHWATERPWLDDLAALLRGTSGVEALVSDLDTSPWTVHAAPPSTGRPAVAEPVADDKEPDREG